MQSHGNITLIVCVLLTHQFLVARFTEKIFRNKAASCLLNWLQSKHPNSNFKLNLKKKSVVFKQKQCLEY